MALAETKETAAEAATSSLKVAICGEVSSGKSAVLQALLRNNFLPDFFGVEDRPVIRVRTGADTETIAVFDADGGMESFDKLSDIEPRSGLAEIQVSQKEPGPFGSCELIEMPPLRDGFLTQAEIDRIAACDILIWVTIGSQAWRLSEKTLLDEIGDRRPSEAILVVSRGDKFRSDEDRERLMDRMERETADYFGERVMMRASPAAIEASGDDDDAWQLVGAKSLADALDNSRRNLACDSAAEEESSARVVSFMTQRIAPEEVVEETVESEVASEVAESANDDAVIDAPTEEVPQDSVETDVQAAEVDAVPTPEPEQSIASSDNQITSFLGTLHGVIAVGSFELGNENTLSVISGDQYEAESLAQFCNASAETLTRVMSFVDETAELESEHISLKSHQILFRISGGQVLFFACESAKLSTGIARTAFARLSRLCDTHKQAA